MTTNIISLPDAISSGISSSNIRACADYHYRLWKSHASRGGSYLMKKVYKYPSMSGKMVNETVYVEQFYHQDAARHEEIFRKLVLLAKELYAHEQRVK